MNDIQSAALAMGLELPLFPSIAYLTCVGCGMPITGKAHDTDEGWLCDECDETTKEESVKAHGSL